MISSNSKCETKFSSAKISTTATAAEFQKKIEGFFKQKCYGAGVTVTLEQPDATTNVYKIMYNKSVWTPIISSSSAFNVKPVDTSA